MRKSFGRTIRAIRKERGLSQDAFAWEAGLDRAFMGRLERGESDPSLTTIRAIAKALQMKPSALLARMER